MFSEAVGIFLLPKLSYGPKDSNLQVGPPVTFVPNLKPQASCQWFQTNFFEAVATEPLFDKLSILWALLSFTNLQMNDSDTNLNIWRCTKWKPSAWEGVKNLEHFLAHLIFWMLPDDFKLRSRCRDASDGVTFCVFLTVWTMHRIFCEERQWIWWFRNYPNNPGTKWMKSGL